MRRRTFLRNSASVASVTVIAGCSALGGSNYTFENAGDDAWETWGFEPQGSRFLAGGRFSLEPGEWTSQGFSSAINIRLSYGFEMSSDTGVEFFVIEADEMEAFENRNDPDIRFSDQIQGNANAYASTDVVTREYSVVLDNTQFGEMGEGSGTASGLLELEGEPL